MRVISGFCLFCVALLVSGEEHNHSQSGSKKFIEHLDVYRNNAEAHVHENEDHEHLHHDDHHHQHSDLQLGHDDHHDTGRRLPNTLHTPAYDYQTWLAASGSILLISLCGIFGVLVIPIMQKLFYQHLIQFLIALAVGTLAGDALLHLLPHAVLALLTAGSTE